MSRDDPVDTSDEEMDEFDRELENFKRFCFMASPLGNRPKVAVKMNLRGLTLQQLMHPRPSRIPSHNF